MGNNAARNKIKLVKLSYEYKTQLFEMMDEWISALNGKRHGTPWAIFKDDYHDFDHYLANLDIKEPTDGKVPSTTLFALDIERNIFVGAVNIRHYLSESLYKDGGHIGDGVRPSERRKGYATEMIRLALLECKKLNIDRVLMVCDSDNIGSKKSILNNGGILDQTKIEGVDENIERYWIVI